MYNVFEDVLPRGACDVNDIKLALLDEGALGATMTGSGPAVFGIFGSKTDAQSAYKHLKKNYRECYLARTTGRLDM